MAVCPVCGLPNELCMCEEIAREQQSVRISVDSRRYGKMVTVIDGIDENDINISDPYAARWDQQAQNETSEMWYQQLLGGDVDTETLYVFSSGEPFLVAQETLQDIAVCAYINNTYYVVFSKESKTIWSPEQADISFEFP